jgi:hypothetical protein
MAAQAASCRPRKRRRHNLALREDDVDTADAIIVESVMHESQDGPVEIINRIPTWTNRPAPSTEQPENVSKPCNDPDPPEMPELQDDGIAERTTTTSRVRNVITDLQITILMIQSTDTTILSPTICGPCTSNAASSALS